MISYPKRIFFIMFLVLYMDRGHCKLTEQQQKCKESIFTQFDAYRIRNKGRLVLPCKAFKDKKESSFRGDALSYYHVMLTYIRHESILTPNVWCDTQYKLLGLSEMCVEAIFKEFKIDREEVQDNSRAVILYAYNHIILEEIGNTRTMEKTPDYAYAYYMYIKDKHIVDNNLPEPEQFCVDLHKCSESKNQNKESWDGDGKGKRKEKGESSDRPSKLLNLIDTLDKRST